VALGVAEIIIIYIGLDVVVEAGGASLRAAFRVFVESVAAFAFLAMCCCGGEEGEAKLNRGRR
jgi:hypothetical protein